MAHDSPIPIQKKLPTRFDSVVFRIKTLALQSKRAAVDLLDPEIMSHKVDRRLADAEVISRSRTSLWTESAPEERFLVAGKIHNLRIAARKLDGLELPAGAIFSFWKHVGRAVPSNGFVVGRELRQGCIIPTVGGGLCQLSNGLYDAAIQAGFEIVERHPHTQVIPGSLAEQGRDATVFWNYVDLRFRSADAFRINISLNSDELIIEFRGKEAQKDPGREITRRNASRLGPGSCATCGIGDCHRALDPGKNKDFGRTAYLVDEFLPEFDRFIRSERQAVDRLMLPINGGRFRKPNYAWSTDGFSEIRQFPLVTARRSVRSRRLAEQGAKRQQNLLTSYRDMARAFAGRLSFDTLHVVVQQNLLPFLWLDGSLGGRTFDVLMTSLPMAALQNALDRAARLHPESTTLGDFRADKELVSAETDALRNARRIITPHTFIASLFPQQAEIIEWKMPDPQARSVEPTNGTTRVVFPASTVGRKGCYELREALREFDVKLILLGPVIESEGFWQGFDVENGSEDWIRNADLVVLPAFIEHRPRRLLAAAAAGIPVIASRACGVENIAGIEAVDSGDAATLRNAIEKYLKL